MKPIYIAENNMITPLGFDSDTNIAQITKGHSAIQQQHNHMMPSAFWASIINTTTLHDQFARLADVAAYTRLEQMMILTVRDILQNTGIDLDEKTALIISTTKGNIDVLAASSPFAKERAYLPALGQQIKDFFGFKNEAIIISNACVSGVLAVAVAKRLIASEAYDNAIVVAGDIVSEFVLSGFNSFQAISNQACKPYCKHRTGINIGEAAASVLVTADKNLLKHKTVKILGDAACNDANHISGPSRTGEGLYQSIKGALAEAKIEAKDIDYISAHGTATPYNDEMEAIAMNRLGLESVPLNSLKAYYGHTLGASGLLETIVGIHSLHHNTLYASKGFETLGVSQAINVIEKTETQTKDLNICLKTASGFGGCNTALIFDKNI